MEEFTAVCWCDLPRAAVFPRGGANIAPICHFSFLCFRGPPVSVNAFSADLISLSVLFFSFLLRILKNFNRIDWTS